MFRLLWRFACLDEEKRLLWSDHCGRGPRILFSADSQLWRCYQVGIPRPVEGLLLTKVMLTEAIFRIKWK